MISTARQANAHLGLLSAFTHSMLLLLLLLLMIPNVFISVCHGIPAASRRHSDVISDDDDDEPRVYAVFERNDHISGKINA